MSLVVALCGTSSWAQVVNKAPSARYLPSPRWFEDIPAVDRALLLSHLGGDLYGILGFRPSALTNLSAITPEQIQKNFQLTQKSRQHNGSMTLNIMQ